VACHARNIGLGFCHGCPDINPFHPAPILKGTCDTATECKYTEPIATLELASSPQTFKERIHQGNAAKYRSENVKLAQVTTYMDLLFILLYWTAFVLWMREYPSGLSKWVIVAIFFCRRSWMGCLFLGSSGKRSGKEDWLEKSLLQTAPGSSMRPCD
jgi:hypothetical protein